MSYSFSHDRQEGLREGVELVRGMLMVDTMNFPYSRQVLRPIIERLDRILTEMEEPLVTGSRRAG